MTMIEEEEKGIHLSLNHLLRVIPSKLPNTNEKQGPLSAYSSQRSSS